MFYIKINEARHTFVFML